MRVPSNARAGEYIVAEELAGSFEITGFRVKGTREACLEYMRRTRWPSKKSGLTLGLVVVVDKDLEGNPREELGMRHSSWVL